MLKSAKTFHRRKQQKTYVFLRFPQGPNWISICLCILKYLDKYKIYWTHYGSNHSNGNRDYQSLILCIDKKTPSFSLTLFTKTEECLNTLLECFLLKVVRIKESILIFCKNHLAVVHSAQKCLMERMCRERTNSLGWEHTPKDGKNKGK